jgi:hypothetical protein
MYHEDNEWMVDQSFFIGASPWYTLRQNGETPFSEGLSVVLRIYLSYLMVHQAFITWR